MDAEENWTEVAEELPGSWTQVLAWAPDGDNQEKQLMRQCIFDGRDFIALGLYGYALRGVTHWRGMPTPPTAPQLA